mmetsp:Transcript_60213/g.90758  ORF Transcript_60213/g.90758 Transcript_60213/m.90758 type:complete len:206 (+) Transcript_60213:2265-2882(+)
MGWTELDLPALAIRANHRDRHHPPLRNFLDFQNQEVDQSYHPCLICCNLKTWKCHPHGKETIVFLYCTGRTPHLTKTSESVSKPAQSIQRNQYKSGQAYQWMKTQRILQDQEACSSLWMSPNWCWVKGNWSTSGGCSRCRPNLQSCAGRGLSASRYHPLLMTRRNSSKHPGLCLSLASSSYQTCPARVRWWFQALGLHFAVFRSN